MVEREREIAAFLAGAGWADALRRPLAGDASFRHYERVRRGRDSAVLMDAPPPEDVRPFTEIARHLVALGYSAPRILAEDAAAGLLLLEDLGDLTYTRALARGMDARALYGRAVDVLAHLHGRPEAIAEGVPAYDTDMLLGEAVLLADWYMPRVIGRPSIGGPREEYLDIWRKILSVLDGQPETLVLRDFHGDNLMWLEDRSGLAVCGLLDFQDAVAGPPAYDLMSLLEDARLDLDGALVAHMLERYFDQRRHVDRQAFETAYRVLAAQRHCKVIGIFTRLSTRDGKQGYLAHISRVWRLLERASAEVPLLAPLAAWLERNIPESQRIPPRRRIEK